MLINKQRSVKLHLNSLNIILKILFSCFFLFASPSYALLPPYYESTKELIDILNNNEVATKITSGRPIQSIEKTENGYKITARECTLDVFIKYKERKDGFVGPAQYEIQTGILQCNNEDKD